MNGIMFLIQKGWPQDYLDNSERAAIPYESNVQNLMVWLDGKTYIHSIYKYMG